MHSVLRNELIFLITFVWPLAIPLALLVAPVACFASGRRPRFVVWGGPIAALVELVRLARSLEGAAAPRSRHDVERAARAGGVHGWVARALAALTVALASTGAAIFLHPGYSAGYHRLLDVHAWLGWAGCVAWFGFVIEHARRRVGLGPSALLAVLLVVAVLSTLFFNEVNPRVLWKVPLVLAAVLLVEALHRVLGPVRAREPQLRAGLALSYLGTVTFASGAFVTEPLNSAINDNMGLYVLFAHGEVPLLVAPVVAVLTGAHVRAALPRAGGWLARAMRPPALAAFAALAVVGSLWMHVKWFGPDGGLHLWPPSALAGLYAALPELSPPHRAAVTADPARAAPLAETPGFREASMNDASVCATSGCHTSLVEQWEQSTHRFAGSNSFFHAAVEQLAASGRRALVPICQGCHDPVGSLFHPQGAEGVPPRDWASSRGVTCKTCHLITSVDHGRGNGAWTLHAEIPYPVTAADPGFAPRWAGFIRADLRLHFRNYANARLFESAEYCTACHRSVVPAAISGRGPVVLSDRYASWSASRYARDGVTCMSCHMREWTRDERGVRFPDHRMPGLNADLVRTASAVAPKRWRLDEAERFTADWIAGRGAVGDLGPLLAVTLALEGEARPGGAVELVVRTTNRRVGHDFPAGPLDLDETWLAVEVRDADGQVLLASGALDASGEIPAGTHRLGARVVGGDGLPIRHHDVLSAVEVRDVRLVPPDATVEDRFAVALPPHSRGPLQLSAVWRHRRANPSFVRWAMGEGCNSR
ncbi:MAG: hypothetical protein IPK07_28120 [Deltaproteobacteria bacterium]|nr:hypothetical protein [Deltaproteobacteria bacterium]